MSKLIENLNWRYATKQFDVTKKINENDLEKIIESFRLTPSSFWLEPWKLIIVESKDLREKLLPVSWNQKQIVDASHLLVFTRVKTIDDNYIDKCLDNSSKITWASRDDLKWYEDMMKWYFSNLTSEMKASWARDQVFLALWNVMNSLSDLRIDSCAIWGFDSVKYDEILWLSDLDLASVVILPIWYRSENDKYSKYPKIRFSSEEVVLKI